MGQPTKGTGRLVIYRRPTHRVICSKTFCTVFAAPLVSTRPMSVRVDDTVGVSLQSPFVPVAVLTTAQSPAVVAFENMHPTTPVMTTVELPVVKQFRRHIPTTLPEVSDVVAKVAVAGEPVSFTSLLTTGAVVPLLAIRTEVKDAVSPLPN